MSDSGCVYKVKTIGNEASFVKRPNVDADRLESIRQTR